MPDPSLLILIPAYNEETRIEPVLRDYAKFFEANYSNKFQILVVLNGCRDNTLGVVQKVMTDFPVVHVLEFKEPIGKGGALIEGLKFQSESELVGYVDADGATPPHSLLDLVKHISEADCVVGSRWMSQSVLHQEQTTLRKFFSRGFHFIVEILFLMRIRDTQCPCKLLKREVVEKIHPALRIADLAFDVNLLVSVKRAGYRIVEVPIEWTDKAGSKVTSSLFRSSMTMFLSVLRIRLIYWPWIYKLLRPLRPLEGWIYKQLRAPKPLPAPENKE
ncbi:MAG TPA: glycosyltransferase [Candidatus Baltobacteraceae bacterium]|nr:glycosyltransferase [Candidatus Baltobacteraceae bacterium]